tara:strand:+ start:245 stop:643 length:399 start_codon:yes stop_codon:yes gene_type:complete
MAKKYIIKEQSFMSKVFIHIHSGPELVNKVSLGLLVAVTSVKEKHDVTVFFAGDGVVNMTCSKNGEFVGKGTGDVKDHLDVLREHNTPIFVSKLSAEARGYNESLLNGYNAKLARPHDLLSLSLDADVVLCY